MNRGGRGRYQDTRGGYRSQGRYTEDRQGGYRGGRGGIQSKMRMQRDDREDDQPRGYSRPRGRGSFRGDREDRGDRRIRGGNRGRGGIDRRDDRDERDDRRDRVRTNAYSEDRGQRRNQGPRINIRSKGIGKFDRTERRGGQVQDRPFRQPRRTFPAARAPRQQEERGPRESATGNPFPNKFKMPTQDELTSLSVKAELIKLSEAPRAYVEKLISNDMVVEGATSGRLTIGDRFSKIQGARQVPVAGQNVRQGKTLRVLDRPRQARQYQRKQY